MTNESNGLAQTSERADAVRRVRVSRRLYPEEAIFRACYLLTDRCYLRIDEDDDAFVVEIRAKTPGSDLDALEGAVLNELLHQRVRLDLGDDFAAAREAIIQQAFSEADFDERG